MASPIYKLGETCEHGALKRQCEICHRDADIAELKHDISRALETNTALLKENEALRAKLAEAVNSVLFTPSPPSLFVSVTRRLRTSTE